MSNLNEQSLENNSAGIHWGHFATVLATMVLLLGISWMKNPELFNLKKTSAAVTDADAPHYYAYVQPPEDTVPLVAGASTNQGPVVISDDGSDTVIPVDVGQVLGESTQDVHLSLDSIKINHVVPDSDKSIQKYFSDSAGVETSPIDNAEFEAALSSSNQDEINTQAAKFNNVISALQNIQVPKGLVDLQKLKIIQYSSAVGILENFTLADQNPQLVGEKLQEFLKSQQDLDDEIQKVVAKYPQDVPANVQLSAQDSSLASVSQAANQNSSDNSLNNAQ